MKQFLDAPPLVRCSLCEHVSEPGDEVSPGGWDAVMGRVEPACDYGERCVRTRRGLSRREPTVIRVVARHFECACCHVRLRNGRQDLWLFEGKIMHADHDRCGPGCEVRQRRTAVPA